MLLTRSDMHGLSLWPCVAWRTSAPGGWRARQVCGCKAKLLPIATFTWPTIFCLLWYFVSNQTEEIKQELVEVWNWKWGLLGALEILVTSKRMEAETSLAPLATKALRNLLLLLLHQPDLVQADETELEEAEDEDFDLPADEGGKEQTGNDSPADEEDPGKEGDDNNVPERIQEDESKANEVIEEKEASKGEEKEEVKEAQDDLDQLEEETKLEDDLDTNRPDEVLAEPDGGRQGSLYDALPVKPDTAEQQGLLEVQGNVEEHLRRSRVRWLLVRWSHKTQGFQANPTEHFVRLISWFRLCTALVDQFPAQVWVLVARETVKSMVRHCYILFFLLPGSYRTYSSHSTWYHLVRNPLSLQATRKSKPCPGGFTFAPPLVEPSISMHHSFQGHGFARCGLLGTGFGTECRPAKRFPRELGSKPAGQSQRQANIGRESIRVHCCAESSAQGCRKTEACGLKIQWLTFSFLLKAPGSVRHDTNLVRQDRVQKRRLQPVTNPEAAAASRRAKNRRRAEGKKRKLEELIHNTKGGRGKIKVKQSKSLISWG